MSFNSINVLVTVSTVKEMSERMQKADINEKLSEKKENIEPRLS